MSTVIANAMKTLEDLFLKELECMYDAESRIVKMLSTTAAAASCWKLKEAILGHLLETEGHVMKLELVFGCFEGHVTGKTSKATMGLVEQGAEIAAEFAGSPAINAALIAFLQKVEHYEIAAYTCLEEWAMLLGYPEAASIIGEILAEENAAKRTFTELARSTSNEEAFCRYGWEDAAETAGMDAAAG
ncbi:MAG: DUF892 family protein [Luteolibacter sp.]